MNSCLVTAVCVTHKINKHLYRALISVSRQSESLKLLLIFDGIVPDKSFLSWLEKVFPGDRVTLHTREHMGLTKQLNWAVRQVKTDWFARIDSDDAWCKYKIKNQLNVVDKLDSKLTIIGTKKALEYPCKPQERHTSTFRQINILQLLKANPLLHSSVLLNTRNFIISGQYDSSYKYTQDYEAWLRVLKCGFSVAIIDAELTYIDQDCKERISIAKSREQTWYELKAFCAHYPLIKLFSPSFYIRFLRLVARIILGRRL